MHSPSSLPPPLVATYERVVSVAQNMRSAVVLLVLSVAALARAQDLCPVIGSYVPSFCTASSDCSVIKCPWSIGSYFAGDVSATLTPCGGSPGVTLDVDLSQPVSLDWSNTWGLDQTDEIAIPGANFDLDVATLGLDADVALTGDISALEIKLGLDVCASVLDISYCGSDLANVIPALNGLIPWIIFDDTFDFSSLCNSWEASQKQAAALAAIKRLRGV